jgi:O-antigen ligase
MKDILEMPTSNLETAADDNPISSSKSLWLAAVIIAAAPLIHFLATWDSDGRLTSQAFAIRHYSIPIMLLEICLIWIAVRERISFKAAFSKIPSVPLILLAIWFVFALIALVADSNGLNNAALILARYLLHGLAFFALIHLISNQTSFSITRWLEVIAMGGIAYAAAIAIFSVSVKDPANFAWMLRLPSATNIRQIANNLGILAIAPIALLLMKHESKKWLCWLAVVAMMAAMVWTGSRATLLGLAIGIFASLAVLPSVSAFRNVAAFLSASVVGVITSLFLPIPHPTFGMFRMWGTIQKQDDVSSGRWEMWANTVEQIGRSPWIGFGSGRYNKNMRDAYGFDFNHPHNVVLQYVYDWGVIGGSIAIMLLSLLGAQILKRKTSDPASTFVAIMAFVTICATAMVDSPLFHPLPIMIAIALISPVFACPLGQKHSPKSNGGT